MDPQNANMNLTPVLHFVDSEPLICDTAILPVWKPGTISTDVYSVLVFTTIILLISLPLTILLNLLVIAAVKSTCQLRIKSNILLACLATTDFVVALTVQPAFITMEVYLLEGKSIAEFCALDKVSAILFTMFCGVSLFHLVLISLERFLAIKHPFFYNDHISAKSLIIASAIAWTLVIIPAIMDSVDFKNDFLSVVDDVLLGCCIPVIVVCHIAIYIEVRRHEKQIISQQISLEARENFEKEKKALKTTTVIILTVIFCNSISITISYFGILKDMATFHIAYILFVLAFTLTLLNSLMNPLVYAARNRRFRVAFVQLLFRKQVEQAEQIEMRMLRFRSNTVGSQSEAQGLP